MFDKEIDTLFAELTEEEIRKLSDSDIDMECELDPKIITRISEKVQAKTGVDFMQKTDKKTKPFVFTKKLRNALIAAVIAILLTVSAGAAVYTFIMPEGLEKQLGIQDMHIKTVVDTDKADENNVKTMQKTVKANGYTVTFEAIVDGYVIHPDFIALLKGYENVAEIKEDRIYAIMTITRDDGKSVLAPEGYIPDCGCCICFPEYLIAVDGYAPNWTTFKYNPTYYEEGNVFYLVCDVTDAGIFADKQLSLIIFNENIPEEMIVRMDKNGECYFVDSYKGLAAMFDFELDKSLANPSLAAKDIAERPYAYVTNPDYSEADKMIAADEAFKNVDLSYAIGKHKWHGYYPLEFGEVEHAEDFIKLYADRKNLKKLGYEAFNQVANENSPEYEAELIAYLEEIAGKPVAEMTDDELNALGGEMDAFNAKHSVITADLLREKFEFSKFADESEYCYIEDFLFLYIPANSDEARIVIVYGDKVVINIECTKDNMLNVVLNHFPLNGMPGDMYAYWYLFGVDADNRYAHLLDENQFDTVKNNWKDKTDAVYSLIQGYSRYDGTVQVFP